MRIPALFLMVGLILILVVLSMLGLTGLETALAQNASWVGVETAGINSRQSGRAWCPDGAFLVALDLDGARNLSPYDSPVVGQAMCRLSGSQWRWTGWVGVETAGINSHQPGRAWCPNGAFLVALDLDGPRNLSPHDSPVVGQALCASPTGPLRWLGQLLLGGRRTSTDK